jgi:hypothetical protein
MWIEGQALAAQSSLQACNVCGNHDQWNPFKKRHKHAYLKALPINAGQLDMEHIMNREWI